MMPHPSPQSTTVPENTPVPQQAAFAILGSMIFLILALLGILVQTTWGTPASATEPPTVVESEHLAGR
jgi:hypothetical protein